MALIPKPYLDCVVAIGIPDAEGKEEWVASGFLYGKYLVTDDKGENRYQTYLVTNRHVLQDERKICLRFNPTEQQPARSYPVDLFDPEGKVLWYAPDDPNIDIAVLAIDPRRLRSDRIQFEIFRSDTQVADLRRLKELGIAEGDFVYALGFPMGIVGGDRNYVIVRGGTIARIQDAIEGSGGEFLIDAFLFPGNSGGPVVLKPEFIAIDGSRAVGSAYLIGVVKGYVPYTDEAVSLQTGLTRVVFQENSGLTAVIPVDFVEEAIQQHLKTVDPKDWQHI